MVHSVFEDLNGKESICEYNGVLIGIGIVLDAFKECKKESEISILIIGYL